MSELLEMRGISKRFPGVQALSRVDFTVRAGEVHALMGENGAGKSTLLKVLTGVLARDEGEVRLEGRPVAPRSPLEAQALGISTVYQEVNLIPDLSVAENLALGRQPRRWGRIDWGRANRHAEEAMRRLNLVIDVTQPLSSYSIAIQQMVAIARALDVSARLLVLDEPTSSLDADEAERLFDVLRGLRARGLGIVFVTHFLDQVYRIADRVTVLRNGQLVGEYETRGLSRLELVSRMVGRDLSEVEALAATGPPCARPEGAAPFLRAQGLGKRGSIEGLDLEIAQGEIVGLAGLLGSGRTESARLLFGLDRAEEGEVRVEGRPVSIRSPRQAIALGFGFLPEDRKAQGIIPELSVRENVVLALQARRGILRYLSPARQAEIAGHYIRALGIATPDADKPVKDLSGGNQQKVILARWLASDPRLLLLDEPTRGVDVGAKAEIERLIRSLCAEGKAILFISSELDEVVRSCGRVAVLRDRRKVAELEGEQISEEAILRAIAREPADAG